MKIGYIRVSDDEQKQALQIDALKAAHCDVVYSDHGVSGIVTERKGLNDVLTDLAEGDTFIVWKFDRVGRSALHLLMLLDQLRSRGIDFISLTENLDTSTPMGRLVYTQLAGFAEFEREMNIERTKAGMAAARKRGQHIGRPALLSDEQIKHAASAIDSGVETKAGMAALFGVSTKTLTRALNKST